MAKSQVVDRLADFFKQAKLSADELESMKLLASALMGPGLKGGEMKNITTPVEAKACEKLLANWRGIIEPAARKAGIPISTKTDIDFLKADNYDEVTRAKRFIEDNGFDTSEIVSDQKIIERANQLALFSNPQEQKQ